MSVDVTEKYTTTCRPRKFMGIDCTLKHGGWHLRRITFPGIGAAPLPQRRAGGPLEGSCQSAVMLRILLADHHHLLREGLKALLERERFLVLGGAANGHEAVQLARDLRPDVAVLDFSMPLLNGLDAAREIQHVSPQTRTLLLTIHVEDHYVLKALRAGVNGYIVKTQAAADLVQAIHDVCGGLIYLSSQVSRVVVDAYLTRTEVPPDPLTSRERQVLQLVAEGKRMKEIAHVLDISAKTAETHRSRITAKLDIHSTAGLVRYALREGMIEL